MKSRIRLPITGGATVIDVDRLPDCESRKWHVNDGGYAVWRGAENGKKKTIRLHRVIAGTPKGLITDHGNHDKLDNREDNLEACTHSKNMRNLSEQGRGYWFQKQNRNWVVEIYGKHIGVFADEAEAARIVEFVRSGGTYVKPERTYCVNGHNLSAVGQYVYGTTRTCRKCQSDRSKKYWRTKNGR